MASSISTDYFKYDVGYFEYVPGLWMTGKKAETEVFGTFNARAVTAAVNVKLRDDDVIVATYPKTGTSWTLSILHLMKHADDVMNGREIPVSEDEVPFIEVELDGGELGAEQLEKLPSPREIKTHLPVSVWRENLEKNPKVKIINVVRNPKDTFVSYFHHYKMDAALGEFTGTWSQFFSLAREGKVCWGDIFTHYIGWKDFLKNRDNSLTLVYEDMKKDLKGNVVRIAEFLGYNLSPEVIDTIVYRTTFKNQRKDPKLNQSGGVELQEDDTNVFMRKGAVGDWRNYFSPEEIDFIDAKCKELLEPKGMKFEFTQ